MSHITTDKDVANVEFSMTLGKILKYITPLYSTLGDNGLIWFLVMINKKTGKVVYSDLGRMVEDNVVQDEV